MPGKKIALILLVAAPALGFMSAGFAADAEQPADISAAPVATSHGLFASWFAPRESKVDAPVVESADPEAETPRSLASIGAARASDLVVHALGLLGISYRFGGNTPASGFDCSGMVRYVFQNALSLDLPRRAEEISHVGTRVDPAELKPGDLVFYKTLRKAFSHVGIYLGNNRFIHAPSSGGSVRVDDMTESYWATRFNGARRVGG